MSQHDFDDFRNNDLEDKYGIAEEKKAPGKQKGLYQRPGPSKSLFDDTVSNAQLSNVFG